MVAERNRVRTLSPYSRMALAVRGWGLEALLALGVFALWRVGTLIDGVGLGVLFVGLLGIAVWRSARIRGWLAETLRHRATARWFGRVLVACEVISRHGALPRIELSESIPAGRRLRVRMPPGFSTQKIEEAAEPIAATIGAREVRVLRNPANASRAYVSLIFTDPLAGNVASWPIQSGTLWDPVSLGIDEEGNPVSVGLPERNLLLGGEPGAGKSVALSLFIAAAALDPAVSLTLLDGKQVELAPWARSAEHFVGPDMGHAIEVLKGLCAEMDGRYSVLLASGLRKIERNGQFGLHVVAVDELAFYMRSGTKDERSELSETLRDLISRGRAAGMIVIAATQKPSNDIVPTYVRDLFSFRMALRCTTPEASDTILGAGWAKEGYSASTLDPTIRGVGWLLAEGAVPVKIRTHYLDDDTIAFLAELASARRAQ
jgi:hypothetical protein